MPDPMESESKTGALVGTSRRKKSSVVRTWLEALLLGAGVVLLTLYGAATIDRLLTSGTLLRVMPAGSSSESLVLRTAADATGNPLPGDSGGPATRSENAPEMEEAPLALLRIPKIHLEVPVLDGTDALTLNHAAGRIEGTALPGQPGNIGIAAHRDSFFRNLGKLRVGDFLELENFTGTDFYIVDGTQIVMPSNVSVLDPRPAPSLTLVTCYPFGYLGAAPQRYIVTAALVQPERGQASIGSPASR